MPRWLRALRRALEAFGRVMSWLILTFAYALVVAPYGLLLRLLRVDPLRLRVPGSAWHAPSSHYERLEDASAQ
jgi:hypothetical protein